MALTLAFLGRYSKNVIGTTEPANQSLAEAVNVAGRAWESMRAWNCLVRPPMHADYRLSRGIGTTASPGTWTESTLTWQAPGTALATYVYTPGDYVTVTGGTGLAQEQFDVASKPASNQITLASSPGADAADATGTLHTPSFRLPDDFRSLIGIEHTDGLTKDMQEVDALTLLRLRTQTITQSSLVLYYSLLTGDDGGTYVCIWPEAGITTEAAAKGGLTFIYRAGWADVGDSTDAVTILPAWMEPLYLEVFAAYLRSLERERIGSWSQMLAEVQAGPVFQNAARQDVRLHNQMLGQMTGGATQIMRGYHPLAASIIGHGGVSPR